MTALEKPVPRFAARYSSRPASARLVLVLVAALVSCRDAAPTRSLGVAPVSPSVGALPSLRPSAAVMPAARMGGTMPAVPPEWNASVARLTSGRLSASLRQPTSAPIAPRAAAGRGIAASVSSTGLPFVRHILLENTTTGDRAAWVIGPSGQITQAVGLGNLSTAWHMAGMGDFNGDGFEDILWENTSDGSRAIWFLNGSGGVIAAVSLGVVPTQWHISGAGDYLGNGQEDILWENTTTGDRVVWLMTGSTVTAAVTIGNLDIAWHMIAADNLCGDNKDDILLENTSTGSRVLWCMNGLQVASALTLGTLATPTWRMAGTGDIDGDGNNDILWENTVTGARVAWLLNGVAGVTAAATLTVEVPAWRITGILIPQLAATSTLAAAGQSAAFLTSPNFSSRLAVQAGSQYLIAVVNTDQSYASQESFTLAGSFSSISASRAVPGISARVAATPATPATPAGPDAVGGTAHAIPAQTLADLAVMRRVEQNHMALLDENRKVFAKYDNPRASWIRARAEAGRAAPLSASFVPVSQTIGTVTKLYVRNSLSGGSCATGVDSIGARTVAVGQHVIVLADTNLTTWPNSLRPDSSFYQTFATEFDQVTYPHTLANIGNPLAYDASLSSIGKITVTITPVLNNFGGPVGGGSVVAFVSSCDFYPYAVNGTFSNQTEMFYSWVPSASGFSVSGWENFLRATAPHEVKHIVSYTDRIMNSSPTWEVIWLEEGLAQESSEIWLRNFNQATWKGHATFLQTVGCELYLGLPSSCDPASTKPGALIYSQLPFLFRYLQTESTSNSEGLGEDTNANYGAGWTIARWATDQYASSGEGTFIKSLINDPSLSGLDNLAAHTGQSAPLLLVYWNVATGVFQTPAYVAADVRTTIPSFNFADIFNVGQTGVPGSYWVCGSTRCGFFTASASPAYPIQPIAVSAGMFAKTVNGVAGTSASYFLLTASSAGIENLQLLSGSGGALSSSSGLRVAILRVQ